MVEVDLARVVEIWNDTGRKIGTGYRISDQHVLTAKHVLLPTVPRRGVEVRLFSTAAEPSSAARLWAEAVVHWASADDDLAVLRVTDPSWPARTTADPLWGRILGGTPVPVVSLGFPDASTRDGHRDTWSIRGDVDPYQEARAFAAGVATVHNVDGITPRMTAKGSPWSGASGAAVFARTSGHLIGIVTSDPASADIASVLRVTLITADPSLASAMSVAVETVAVAAVSVVRGARGPLEAGAGGLGQPPGLPHHLVARPDVVEDLVRRVQADGRLVALVGMGGAGKSTLAAIAFHDPRVRSRFPDGVTWLDAGPDADPVTLLTTLAYRLGISAAETVTVQHTVDLLVAHLRLKRLLIVADNVWSREPIDALKGLGPECTLLFTSRHSDLAETFGADHVSVHEMGQAQALELLARWVGLPVKGLPEEARVVCARVGHLALGVAVAGAMIHQGNTFADLLDFVDSDLDGLQADLNPRYAYRSLHAAVTASIGQLPEPDQRRYVSLAGAGRTPFPRTVAEVIWSGELSTAKVGSLLASLVGKSLLTGAGPGRYVIHDVLYDILAQRLGPTGLAAAHASLLDGYSSGRPEGWLWAASNPYLAATLTEHLHASGRFDELRAVLSDPTWIQARIIHSGVPDLISDYRYAADALTQQIRRALLQSARVVAADSTQVYSQLFSRLSGHSDTTIADWARRLAHRDDAEPHLFPLAPALIPSTDPIEQVFEHPGGASAVDITADGTRAVTGGKDGTLCVWDLTTGLRTILVGDGREVQSLAVTADGATAISGSRSAIWLWDLMTGQHRELSNDPKHHLGQSVAISADGTRAVACGWSRALWTWDLPAEDPRCLTGRQESDIPVFVSTNHNSNYADRYGNLTDVAITGDGGVAVAGTDYGTVLVWDLVTGEYSESKEQQGWCTQSVAVSADGNRIVFSVSLEDAVLMWDRRIDRYEKLSGDDFSVAVSADGTRALAGRVIWDLATMRHELVSRYPRGGKVALSADGDRGASLERNGEIRVWDLAGRRSPQADNLPTPSDAVSFPTVKSVAFSSDGTVAVTAEEYYGGLGVWDLTAGTYREPGEGARMDAVAVSPDGRRAVSVKSYDGGLLLWDLATGQRSTLINPEGGASSVAFTSDGLRAICSKDGGFCEVVLATGHLKELAPQHAQSGHGSVNASGSWAFSVTEYGRLLTLWDVATGESVELSGKETPFVKWYRSLTVADDGAWAAAGEEGGIVHVWNVAAREHFQLAGRSGKVSSVAIAPADYLLVAGSIDGVVQVWDLATMLPVARWVGDSGIVTCAWLSGPTRRIGIGQEVGPPYLLELSGYQADTQRGQAVSP